MEVIRVQIGCDERLEPVAEDFLCQLHADVVSSLCVHLALAKD